jgi:ribosomal protein S18 acetylase RimI-like enzyme
MDSDPAATLTTIIEENLYVFGRTQFAKWPRIQVFDRPEALWFMCDEPSPMFNVVHRARWPAAEASAGILSLQEQYRRRDLPVLWWVAPSSTPPDLGRFLIAHGFKPVGETTGMALDLATLELPAPPETIRIEPTLTTSQLEAFSDTMCRGFELAPAIFDAMRDLALAMGYGEDGPLINYLAQQNGRNVATASLFIDGDIAGIYNVATLPSARRRGIGSAVTGAALSEAVRRGCRLAVLHSSQQGKGLYHRLGFTTVCYFHEYLKAVPA